MRKHILLVFLLISFGLNNAFGQEFTKNTIYGGISTTPYGIAYAFGWFSPIYAIGLDIGYEYSFNNRFSASVEVGLDPFLILYADIKGRWYPWAESFFLGLGIGAWGLSPVPAVPHSSIFLHLSISPTLGWKINTGKQKKLILMPYATFRVFLPLYAYYGFHVSDESLKVGFNVGYTF
jgi:hypothetical protein